MSSGWREGWTMMEDAVMRQKDKGRRRAAPGREYDDIPREKGLIETVAPPPSPPTHFPPSYCHLPHACTYSIRVRPIHAGWYYWPILGFRRFTTWPKVCETVAHHIPEAWELICCFWEGCRDLFLFSPRTLYLGWGCGQGFVQASQVLLQQTVKISSLWAFYGLAFVYKWSCCNRKLSSPACFHKDGITLLCKVSLFGVTLRYTSSVSKGPKPWKTTLEQKYTTMCKKQL